MNISLLEQVSLPKPKCLLYEPLCETEGTCFDGSVVNLRGCDNPEDCDRYKNFINKRK